MCLILREGIVVASCKVYNRLIALNMCFQMFALNVQRSSQIYVNLGLP